MQKDIVTKKLEEYNDVFADIFNNLVFGGEKVLDPDHLVPLPTESFTRNQDGSIRQGNRDIRKADRRKGRYRLILSDENQQGIDNTMPQRVMGYEYASYEEQIRQLMDGNKKNQNPAYTRRIHDNQKLAPVVTAVLYWGTEEWKTPLTLHDMLEFPTGMEAAVRPYVADYPMNLISLKKLPEEVRSRLTSDFRLIAEYMAHRKEPEKLRELVNDRLHKIQHPEEFLDTLGEIIGDGRFKEVKERMSELVKRAEENDEHMAIRMILDEYQEEAESRGIQSGMQRKLVEMICKKLRKGRSPERIAEDLDEELGLVQNICKAAASFAPEYDSHQVLEMMASGQNT